MTDTDIAQAGTGPLHIGMEVANCQTTEPADPHASHFVNGPDEPLSTTAEVCFLDAALSDRRVTRPFSAPPHRMARDPGH